MPAEWEPHSATWLTWPHDESHWPGIFHDVEPMWARMVKELEASEDVHIVIHDDATEESARTLMKKEKVQGDRVHLHRIPNDFSWARDHGPTFLVNEKGEKLLVDWQYNAWGNKWEYMLDDDVPKGIADITGIERVDGPMVLEGGSIDVNGKGTLLTTSSCLLHPNRNPFLSKEEIERNLKDYLNVSHILWLEDGIVGDDTNGHIDDLARFVDPTTVVTIEEKNTDDVNFEPLQKNLSLLSSMNDQDGHPFTIHALPMPNPVIRDGMRLPATYANFYIANAVVLVPVFDDPHDAETVDVLSACFKGRRICPIVMRDFVYGLGAFHCVTQQEPAGASRT